jgi:hypothetical protein
MPVDEIIVLQVKHDELTVKVPFVPKFPSQPTRLSSEERVVRGYKVRLFVQTKDNRPERQDHYGVFLILGCGPFPRKVKVTHKLVHHDGNFASVFKSTVVHSFTEAQAQWGYPNFVPKADLASPDNNPYVKDGYVTFTCTFSFL